MSILLFFILTFFLLFLHYFLFTEKTKNQLKKYLGGFFISRIYRIFYSIFTVSLFIFLLLSLFKLPSLEIINWQDSLSNISYLIIATLGGLVSCFLMIEAIWTLGIMKLTGLKQLFSKKNTAFYLDHLIQPLTIKGLYQRHRHPLLFYSIPFSLFVLPSFSTNNLIALIIIIIYYPLFAKMVESQLLNVYKKDFKEYTSQVNFFLPMLNKYQNESIKK